MLRTHPIMRWVCGHRVSDRSHVSVAVRRVGRCRSVRSLLSRFLWAPRAFGSNLIKLFKGEELNLRIRDTDSIIVETRCSDGEKKETLLSLLK
jgi:hypothetical protein